MATGASAARANAHIDADVALGTWIKLHVGDPGAAGASNAAANTTRKQATFAAASGGSAATTGDLDWTDAEVTTAEDYTHFSQWTASTAGTFLRSGTLTANAVLASGDAFKIPAGSLTLTESVAA